MAYFDYNATTPLFPEAEKALVGAYRNQWGNPSSPYRLAAKAQNALNENRAFFAGLMGCELENVIFCSGATEANNAYFRYLARVFPNGQVMVSAIEHPCVLDAAEHYFGKHCHLIPVDEYGVVDLSQLEEMLSSIKPISVSIMAANNETGVLQPVEKIRELCRQAKVFYHCDASQWYGKIFDRPLPRSDFTVGCAHKFGGPKGVGFAGCSSHLRSMRFQLGGTQEHEYRAGTENFPGVAGMQAAYSVCQRHYEAEGANQNGRDAFEKMVREAIPGTRIVGERADRLWNTSLLIMPDKRNTRWVNRLDKAGFEVSTGSACSTGKVGPSHVLAAMGYSAEEADRAVRVSGWWSTKRADWEELAKAFGRVQKDFDDEAEGDSMVISI